MFCVFCVQMFQFIIVVCLLCFTRLLTELEIRNLYPGKRVKLDNKRMFVMNTKFQMAETSLVCQVINFYESQPETSAVMETGFTYKEKFITFADIFKVDLINVN